MTSIRSAYRCEIPGYVPLPRIALRMRLLRDGSVTPGEKRLQLYRGYDTTSVLCLEFWAPAGEFSQTCQVSLAAFLNQGEWFALGIDDAPPRMVRATYLAFSESATITFNITSPVDKPEGFGYLAGEFPDGITTRLDTPISATIKVLHTTADGRTGKVAEVVSNPDGAWAVHGLDPSKKFDVICSLPGFNDLIWSGVYPTTYPYAVIPVDSTDTVYGEATSQAKDIPDAVLPGDLLLAFVMHRSALTPPSGWTLVRTESVAVPTGSGTHRLSVYSRSAEPGDGGKSTLWTQAISQRIAVVIQAYRRPGASTNVIAHAGRTAIDEPYMVSAVAATAEGQMAVVAVTFNGAPSGAVNPPSGYELSTPNSGENNRLGLARRPLSSGSSSSGSFSADPVGASAKAHAQISVVIG